MTRVHQPLADRSADSGFSLIEVLIVTVVLGIIMSALTSAVIVTLNAAPDTEARLDDARSTRSLATWLSHDTTSAPPFLPEHPVQGGIDIDTADNGANNECGGAGSNLLHMRWTETATVTSTHVANYRFVDNGSEAIVRRYACSRVGAAPSFTLTFNRPITPGLDPANPPTVTGDQPGGPGTDVESVSFTLNGLSGETVLVETASRNPSDFFP